MSWFTLGLSNIQKEKFSEFQKNRLPSMKVIGRGTLVLSVEDARNIRKQKKLEATLVVSDLTYFPQIVR